MDYTIGLDIGTNSVGFAVLDKDCKLVKKRNKNLLGVRLFDEGQTAAETRVYRSTRRRLERRKNRIKLLRDLVKDETLKNDPEFFDRLENSFFREEDKENVKSKNILFNDKNFKDKDFFKKYSTIYHLRKELIEKHDKKDIRKVYLALHHIIKYRGHFLLDGELNPKNNYISDVNNLMLEVFKYYNISDEDTLEYEDLAKVIIDEISKNNSKSSKVDTIKANIKKQKFGKDIEETLVAIVTLIFGKTADFKKVYYELPEPKKIVLSSEKNLVEIENEIGDSFYIFELIKNTYSSITLSEILDGETSISSAMVNKFDKHTADFKLVKDIYKKYDNSEYRKLYKKIFKSKDDVSYSAYINHKDCKKVCTYEDFTNALKKDLNEFLKLDNCTHVDEINRIIVDIENGTFMPKQRTTDNINIPHQLHYNELKKILENQGQYYDCLKENQDKILQIFKFKLPYYVGPLTGNPNALKTFNWAERKILKEKIYPWNFEEIIDIDKSAEKFIHRMRNKCTYFVDEDTLPANSLYIAEFNMYNELNKIRVNGKIIDKEFKQLVVEKLFKTKKKVTKNALEKLYLETYHKEVNESKGYQKEDSFASSLVAYRDFDDILGGVNNENINMIEDIVFWLTIFNEKDIIERKINDKYKNLISSEQLKRILKLNYSGWARVSKKLVYGITSKKNEKAVTILDVLRSTDMNFMQIINTTEFEFKEIIEKSHITNKEDITQEDINELQGSPALKKSVWQSVLIVKEIEKIMGDPPKNVFIELARDDDNRNEKVRTKSRFKMLQECFVKLSEISDEYNTSIKERLSFAEKDKNNTYDMSKEMIYLYFLQNGKCLYTGKPLNIDELSTTCHVDHIIPRKLIKDDSIENKALVLSKENARKSDDTTLSEEIINRQRGYWRILKNAGLMSGKKYYNLTRSNFTPEDIEGFIARQLVETRQITIHVKNLLENYYNTRKTATKVKSVKAGIGSELRLATELYKVRELNCYHHAHDAYLTAVIGKFVDVKFGKLDDLSLRLKYKNVLQSKGNYIVNRFLQDEPQINSDGEIIWENGSEIVAYMKKVFNYRDVLVSKKVEEQSGAFYKQGTVKKGEAGIGVNKKTQDKIDKYGGYTGIAKSMFMLVGFKDKKKSVINIIDIPIYKMELMKTNQLSEMDFLQEYFIENKPKVDFSTVKVLSRFGKYQEIILDNVKYQVASSSELHSMNDLLLNDEYKKVLYGLENKSAIDRHNENKGVTIYSQVSFEQLKGLCLTIIEKGKKMYPYFEGQFSKLDEVDFESLENNKETKEELEKLILDLLVGLQRGPSRKDIVFKKAKLSGFGRINKSFGNVVGDVTLVTKSVTGFYEKKDVVNYEF